MATQTVSLIPIDEAAEAGQLADLFNDLSQALDNFRLDNHMPPLSPGDLARLKDEAQAMEDRAHHFTAQAIGATLQSIQPHLTTIKGMTAQAKEQLEKLENVSRVISIATFVLSLGTAIAAGNPASILATGEALAHTLTS